MAERETREPANMPARTGAARRRILVVEDDPEAREAVQALLEQEGCVVVLARDGLDALRQLEVGPVPDLILLDLVMPRMDGWAFNDARRRVAAWNTIPVVVTSSFAGHSRTAPYLGVAAVLEKPVAPEALLQMVREFGGVSAG